MKDNVNKVILFSFHFLLILHDRPPLFYFNRSLLYEFEQKITYMEIEGNRYVLGEKTLGNKTRRRYPHDQAKYFERTTTTEDFFESEHSIEVTQMPEDNEDPDVVNLSNCYCNGECNPSGLINITACRYGAPVFVSLPHFYKADPILSKQVTGMNPNENDHNFYITLEPVSYFIESIQFIIMKRFKMYIRRNVYLIKIQVFNHYHSLS